MTPDEFHTEVLSLVHLAVATLLTVAVFLILALGYHLALRAFK